MSTVDITKPIPTEPGVCRSCGSALTGTFCQTCGEKVFVEGEHTVKHFFGDVLGALFFVDSKFVRTVKWMLRKPGEVSYQIIQGRRVPFIKPMSMFFIVNLIYFLFPVYDTLNSSLQTQMNNLPHSGIAKEMVEKRVRKEKVSMAVFSARYEQQSTNLSKMCLFLVVLFFSVPLWLLNYNKKLTYFDHLTVALELWSVAIFVLFVVIAWLFYLTVVAGYAMGFKWESLMDDNNVTWVSVLALSVILFFIERNAYKQGPLRAITKAAMLVFAFYVVLQVYRGALFFISMWTI